MAFITSSILLDIVLSVLPVLYLVYWYVTRDDDYWDKRGVQNVRNRNTIFKSLFGLQSQHELCLEMYNKFPDSKLTGFFQSAKRTLMVRDPRLIEHILKKDFVHFPDRGRQSPLLNEPLTQNLFRLRGKIWRALRHKLTPTFTTGKLKMMLEQVFKSSDNLMENLQTITHEGKPFESKEVMYEFALDVISNCAFGLQLQQRGEEFETFKSNVSKMFTFSVTFLLRTLIVTTVPRVAQFIGLTGFPKDASEYFLNFTKATLKFRKENGVKRNDYLQLLLTLKEQEESGKDMITTNSDATEDDAVIDQMRYTEKNGESATTNMKLMTEEIICANSFTFLMAGSESMATTISFTLLNLAQQPLVQQKLQKEVESVLEEHGRWTYDALKDLTYMDQVVQETLRIYPLVPILHRECVIPYKVPGMDLVIEKGVTVAIPVSGLHTDPQYYPQPDRFNPERFEGNNFKPNPTYLPFGDGPRVCIAMRFAVMEIKTSLARIMSQYTVKLSPKTKTPITLKKRTLLPEVEGGIWIILQSRKTLM